MLDVILIIIGALCMIAGLAGCILPFLPGPPLLTWDCLFSIVQIRWSTVLRN